MDLIVHNYVKAAIHRDSPKKYWKMTKTTSELILIAGMGVSIIIDASQVSTSDIILIVGSVGRKGGHITIKKCNTKSILDLMTICRVYPTNITLDFSE